MRSKKLKLINLISAIFLAVLLTFFAVFGAAGSSVVYAVESTNKEYSNVLDDLHKDSTFNESMYPEIADDYSLKVIQIAESMAGDLFIYVYQPSGQEKNLNASSINISTTINDEINYYNYKLQLLNSDGVFYKYKVTDFTVLNIITRYYVITSIYRPFDKTIDNQADNGNLITEVNYEVAKQYCFSEINGKPYVSVVDIETITITDKFVGLVRYSDGYKFYPGECACDSHFVAFNTDKPIDKLLEADVYYTAQGYSPKGFEDKKDEYAHLKYTQKVEYNGGGFKAGTYRWDRVETVDQFIAENDLTQNVYSGAVIDVSVANKITEEGKISLQNKKWLLRFAETSYTKSVLPGTYGTEYTEDLTLVGNVTILRLKFEMDGVPYNLGVIDNKQTGSSKPINTENTIVDFSDSVKRMFAVACLILFVIAIAVICPLIFSVLKYLFKAVAFVIELPFKLLKVIFKLRK